MTRDGGDISHRRACQLNRRVAEADKQRQARLLHIMTEHTTQHHNVSKRVVFRGVLPSIYSDEPDDPAGEKSEGGGGEAAAEAAEESASRDCASEAAGEV
jgi:hypothetical protein